MLLGFWERTRHGEPVNVRELILQQRQQEGAQAGAGAAAQAVHQQEALQAVALLHRAADLVQQRGAVLGPVVAVPARPVVAAAAAVRHQLLAVETVRCRPGDSKCASAPRACSARGWAGAGGRAPRGPVSRSCRTPSSMSTSTARALSVRIGPASRGAGGSAGPPRSRSARADCPPVQSAPVPSPTGSCVTGSRRPSTFLKKLLSASSYRPLLLYAACSRRASSQKRHPIWLPHCPTWAGGGGRTQLM